jgi:Tol biopolymer transport system component
MKKIIKILKIFGLTIGGAIVILLGVSVIIGVLMFSPLLPVFFEATGIYAGEGFGGIFHGCRPNMSPDGTKIVFASPRSGRGDIYLINSDGTNLIQLTKNEEYEGEPAFSPDGSKIAYISEKHGAPEIFIMNVDGTNQTRLTKNNHNRYIDKMPSFTADGKQIEFNRIVTTKWDWTGSKSYNEHLLINIDGTGLKEIPIDPLLDSLNKKKIGSYITLSPDGKKVIFLSDRKEAYQYELYSMDSDEKNIKQLTNLKGYLSDIAFSPDGNKIVFLYQPEGAPNKGKGQIYNINLDGTGLKLIRNNY